MKRIIYAALACLTFASCEDFLDKQPIEQIGTADAPLVYDDTTKAATALQNKQIDTKRVVDAIEAMGIAPADAAPDYWRHVHNRLSAGQEPNPYTPERHAAWLNRRRIWT